MGLIFMGRIQNKGNGHKSELAPAAVRLEYTILRDKKAISSTHFHGRSVKGKRVFAQVTRSAHAPSKLESLIRFANGAGVTVCFSRDQIFNHPGLDFHFNLDRVFTQMFESGVPAWRQMLREMAGLERE